MVTKGRAADQGETTDQGRTAGRGGATEPGGKTDQGETTRYLVECQGCEFERTANRREEATRIGSDHREETDHRVVALEVPPSIVSS